MPLAWHIRTAQAADASSLERCMHAAYTPYLARLGNRRLPPLDADYAAEIRDFPCWVVDSPRGIIGGLIMNFGPEPASIANVAIHPGFHGQGIGGVLMRLAESAAVEQKRDRLQLATHRKLHENLSLYRHLGWCEIGRQGDRVLFEKTITPPQ